MPDQDVFVPAQLVHRIERAGHAGREEQLLRGTFREGFTIVLEIDSPPIVFRRQRVRAGCAPPSPCDL